MSAVPAPLTISLNGVDNIGKTTQLRWLDRGLQTAHDVGPVDAWHARWAEVASSDFARWWFETSSTTEHVDLVMESHRNRRSASESLALEDRGLPMLRAACAATAAIKDDLDLADALSVVELLSADADVPQGREFHILLRHGSDPAGEAEYALAHEAREPDARYAAYQHALAGVLHLQAERGEYDAVLTVADQSILDVHRQVGEALKALDVVVDTPEYTPDRVWVLAGMSESGKSTVGELLRDEHGVTRLKIGYLLGVAAARAGVENPYGSWSEIEQAEHLAEEVLRFGAATKAKTVSLESARRFAATAHFKRVLGDRCSIVYVDATPESRTSRALESVESLQRRDVLKADHGADRIATRSDHVLDNNGPLSALKLSVARLVAVASHPLSTPEPWVPQSHKDWLQRATEHLVDDQVVLVLATGSTGTAHWRREWSDHDLLIVRGELPADWLRDVAGTLTPHGGVKMGISAFTTADISAMRLPPRVIQSLRRASLGEGVLYRRPDFAIPVPSAEHGDRSSRGDLGLVLMTTRRLLAADQPDARALYKHLVLLAKVILRSDGVHVSAPEEVIAGFKTTHPAAGIDPPALDVLVGPEIDVGAQRQLIGSVHSLLGYVDQLDRITRSSRP